MEIEKETGFFLGSLFISYKVGKGRGVEERKELGKRESLWLDWIL